MVYDALYAFDGEARKGIGGLLCGVDEAGRGPLAGPVACAAVILRPESRFDGLNDSKKVSEKRREALYDAITSECVAFAVALVDNRTIDEINILQATMLGMRRAVEDLGVPVSLALIDGNCAPQLSAPCRTVIGGDGLSASVAAASILAKVTRDRFMRELALRYPQYGFEKHKGYPTKEHYAAIDAWGVTAYHRRSFLKGRAAK
ncbi:MAG: ribonuclease HII [Oscillospiraceae bacterium]|nr:ribonuclease HII [Oscillospiraceae bacterium]